MAAYPIEKIAGSRGGAWVVWSLPVEHTVGRSAEGLETFPTYALGMAECSRRNLQIAIYGGFSDDLMPALDGGRGGISDYTYREFYEATVTRHEMAPKG